MSKLIFQWNRKQIMSNNAIQKSLNDLTQEAKTISESKSDNAEIIAREILLQHFRYAEWKKGGREIKYIIIDCKKMGSTYKLTHFNSSIRRTLSLENIKIGSNINVWASDKECSKLFRLCDYELNDFNSRNIFLEITKFFGVGFNLKKIAKESCNISVFTGQNGKVKETLRNASENEFRSRTDETLKYIKVFLSDKLIEIRRIKNASYGSLILQSVTLFCVLFILFGLNTDSVWVQKQETVKSKNTNSQEMIYASAKASVNSLDDNIKPKACSLGGNIR